MKKFLKSALAVTLAAAWAFMFTPGVPRLMAAYTPGLVGPLTGDCSTPAYTPTATVAALSITSCTKLNGVSPGTLFSQNASGVNLTGGTINGTSIGATTPAAGTFTLGGYSALFSPLGGLQVGAATVTSTSTLTTPQMSVCTNGGAAFTLTLPASPVEGQRVDVSDCGGQAGTYNVTIVGSGGAKVNYSTSGLVFNVNFQSATFTYRAAFGWIVT